MQKFKRLRGFRFADSLPERLLVTRGRAAETFPLDIARGWLLLAQIDPQREADGRKARAFAALKRARTARLCREHEGRWLP
jgi:hypothetical protein